MLSFIEKVSSSWILPSGEVFSVPSERHDLKLPKPYISVIECEKVCIRISAPWGFTLESATIHLPNHITEGQKVVLAQISKTIDLQTVEMSIRVSVNRYEAIWYKDLILHY